MSINPVQPITLQQILSGSVAAATNRAAQGDQAAENNIATLAAAAQAHQDQEASAVKKTESAYRSHEQDDHQGKDTNRRRGRNKQTKEFPFTFTDEEGEEHVDLEA